MVDFGMIRWGVGTVLFAGRFDEFWAAGVLIVAPGRGAFCGGRGAEGDDRSETLLRFAFGLPRDWVIVTSVLKYHENPGFRCSNKTI